MPDIQLVEKLRYINDNGEEVIEYETATYSNTPPPLFNDGCICCGSCEENIDAIRYRLEQNNKALMGFFMGQKEEG